MGTFHIDADRFSWICGPEDDPDDLCLHGHVTVQIGDAVLEDDGTVSATALYLLKTLTEDKVMDRNDIQMIPCCGHFLIASGDLQNVEISGCDNGTDWSTFHEGDRVRLVLPSGREETVELSSWEEEASPQPAKTDTTSSRLSNRAPQRPSRFFVCFMLLPHF